MLTSASGCSLFDQRNCFIFVQPVGEVLLEEWSLSTLTNTGHVGPFRIALVLDKFLKQINKQNFI